MIQFKLLISPEAINDLDQAIAYYDSLSEGLGSMFADIIDRYFTRIQHLPSSSAIVYDQVRVKAVDTFPFAIHYTLTNAQIIILRIFNTHQKPIH
jgi:toxin ParE1/3/4